MGERYLERIVASGIKIGTIQTLKALGLLPEVVTISQAEKIYGRRLITEWRSKEWIKVSSINSIYPLVSDSRTL